MAEQLPRMPPPHRAPLDPWPTQPAVAPESDEPFGPREAGPDEPLEERRPPVRPSPAGAPGSEGHPSPR